MKKESSIAILILKKTTNFQLKYNEIICSWQFLKQLVWTQLYNAMFFPYKWIYRRVTRCCWWNIDMKINHRKLFIICYVSCHIWKMKIKWKNSIFLRLILHFVMIKMGNQKSFEFSYMQSRCRRSRKSTFDRPRLLLSDGEPH